MSANRGTLLERVQAVVSPVAKLRRAARLAEAGQVAEAFALLSPLAERGVPQAQLRVGRAYLDGQGVPPSRIDAARWFERAASAGLVEAQSLLAALHLTGVAPSSGNQLFAPAQAVAGAEGTPDFEAAAHWARRAAEAGGGDAKALLAYIHASGPDAMRDQARSDALYEESAVGGSPQGALGHGLVLLRRASDEAGKTEAGRWIAKAAQANLPLALYLLGVMLDNGIGMQRDPAAAAQLYRQAGERGVRQGQARWGLALLEGRGVARDLVAGESWLRRAALAGDVEAAALVGDLYAKGGELPPNYAEAAIWFSRAAEGGHKAAARALAMLHLTGAGVARDPDEAARWFRRAAEQGDQLAQADLANLVLGGAGEPEDRMRTRAWFEAAAKAGDLVAAFNFGVCLAEGVGVERDERQAALWLRRAAERVVNAQYWYGRMLAEGRGVDADPVEGRAWIKRAADSGLMDAQVSLAEMMVNGRGGPRDHATALALFRAAAETGHVGAAFATGAMLGGGHDVEPDRAAAQGWFRQAAERGHPYAQLMLGRYLARTLAGEHDPAQARHWLEQARARGVTEAAGELGRIPNADPGHLVTPRCTTAGVERYACLALVSPRECGTGGQLQSGNYGASRITPAVVALLSGPLWLGPRRFCQPLAGIAPLLACRPISSRQTTTLPSGGLAKSVGSAASDLAMAAAARMVRLAICRPPRRSKWCFHRLDDAF